MIDKITSQPWKMLLLGIIFLCCVWTSPSYAASGTLIVVKREASTWVLLVRPKSRNFYELTGGTTEIAKSLNDLKPSLETDYQTAIRETVEETRGYFGHRELIASSDPCSWKIEVDGFIIYRVLTTPFELTEIQSIKLPIKPKKHWKPMLEIIDYAWVDIQTILNSKQLKVKDISGREIALRKNLPEYIRLAKKKGWFEAH